MAYTAPNPVDRVAVDDNIFEFIPLGGNLYRVVPRPTSVIVPGTPINRALLKPLIDAVSEHDTKIYTDIPQDIEDAVLGNTNGWETLNITAANFTNGVAEIAIPYKRFMLFASDALLKMQMSEGNSYIIGNDTDSYQNLPFVLADKNTRSLCGIIRVSKPTAATDTPSYVFSKSDIFSSADWMYLTDNHKEINSVAYAYSLKLHITDSGIKITAEYTPSTIVINSVSIALKCIQL